MEDVLLRCLYVKQPDGSYLEVRYFGRTIVWVGQAPVLIFQHSVWPWLNQEPPSLALVKEGPKAITVKRR